MHFLSSVEQLCQEDDMRMFTYLIPDVYSNFLPATVSNPELMLLVCSTIDGMQLLELMCQVLQGHLVMFRKDSILALLSMCPSVSVSGFNRRLMRNSNIYNIIILCG